MLLGLPRELQAAVEEELRGVDPRRLQADARRLSERYRAHEARGRARFVDDEEGARAHAAFILPQSFAQVSGALRMVPLRVGAWRPRSLLDIGAGPGTAAWAASELWPGLQRVVHCETSRAFLDLGRRLSQAASSSALREALWDERDVVAEGLPAGRHDLVVLSLVLSELAPLDRRALVATAWRRCEGLLVVVEPGTPATFEVVRHARAQLLRAGAHTIAPCPHEGDCPMPAGDWCHFAERTQRPEFQRRAKGASLPWEDAKFSFAALARFESAAPPWGRVLHDPKITKGRVMVSLCGKQGLVEGAVGRADREAYRAAKELAWGSAVEREQALGQA